MARFEPKVNLDVLFGAPENSTYNPFALLDVFVPLHTQTGDTVTAIAEFLMDGHEAATQLEEFDRYLNRHAFLFFMVGSAIIAVALAWAFSRLQRANDLLSVRTSDLLKANHELTLAAKTSAIGAVTAHLIHGLKNPLFGLQSFVSMYRGAAAGVSDSAWQLALNTTNRMQTMIGEIVRILQEEQGEGAYEITVEEMAQMVHSKVDANLREGSVHFESTVQADGSFTNHYANLVILVLTNLIQNSIQAMPAGKKVYLKIAQMPDAITCTVIDEGGGLPESVRNNLFAVGKTTKVGGTGLGLAISKQLSNHMGATLDLESTGPTGTSFVLTIPAVLMISKRGLASEAAMR